MAERSDSLRLLILDVGTSSMRGTLMDGQGRQLDQVQIHYHRCDRTNFTTIFRHSCRRAGIAASPGDHVAGRPQPRDLY